jgi:hypothetical protein
MCLVLSLSFVNVMKCLLGMILRNIISANIYWQLAYDYNALVSISAPPKVTNVKIIGDLRENGKVTATGIVTGGTEGSSRVQWYKTYSSTLDESNLEALSTSKIAKVGGLLFLAIGVLVVSHLVSIIFPCKGYIFLLYSPNSILLFSFDLVRHSAFLLELLAVTLLQNIHQ